MKLIKNTFILVFLSLVAFSSCKKDANSFVLSGTIIGEQPEKVILKYTKDTLEIADTAIVENGKFQFKGSVNEPTIASLSIMDGMLWLESGEINIEIDANNHTQKVTGSKTQDEQALFFAKIDSLTNALKPLTEEIMLLEDSISKSANTTLKENLIAKRDTLVAELSRKQPRSSSIQMNFIKQYPASFYATNLLYPLVSCEVIPLDTAIALYDMLDKNVKQGYFGKKIEKDISLLKKNRPGSPAPDFEANDILHQRLIRLSNFKGKVVLMDFWAPWCGPCRRGFKYLKPLQEKYSSKGLEVIAVYTDSKEEKETWLQAIEDDGVQAWHHVRIAENMLPDKETNKDIRSNYYVQAIPRKVLIDANGNIVKMWIGVSPDIEKDVEETVSSLMSK